MQAAFMQAGVSESHFVATTGYGYGDRGRDVLDEVYARALGAEDALCRYNFVSGTHTLTVALFGVLRPGDTMLSVTGMPYDTLRGVIGEEMLNRLVLIFAAIAVFVGCAVGAGRTSKRVMLTVCCAAASWLVMQVTGILAYGELLPERSLQTAAAMAAGAAASLLMKNGKKKGRGNKARARRGRR